MPENEETFDRNEEGQELGSSENEDTAEPFRTSDAEVVENIRVEDTPGEVIGVVEHTQNRDLINPSADNRRQYDRGLTPPVHRSESGERFTAERNTFNGEPPHTLDEDENSEDTVSSNSFEGEGDRGQALNL